MKSQRVPAFLVFVFLSIPLLVASAQSTPPTPSESSSSAPSASVSAAAPPKDPLSATIFSGTSKAPSEDAWKNAVEVTGIRMGADAAKHGCYAEHIGEWVRIDCKEMDAARVDLLAGEKRDFMVIAGEDRYRGENIQAQFSMHPGDRRIIQWIMPDLWSQVWPGDNGEWMSGGSESRGPMLGVSVQVDWASGPEPMISIF